MAVYSMTGYASAQKALALAPAPAGSAAPAPRLALELRSVNSRFLDIGFKLADELRQHEPQLRELLSHTLKRGKVELRAALETRDSSAFAEPTPQLLQRLASVQDQVRAWLPDAAALSTADVLRLSSHGAAGTGDAVAQAIDTLAREVLAEFIAARGREGERLARLLHERVDALRRLASQAEPLIPQAVQAQKQRFLTRWNEAMGATDAGVSSDVAEERALTEATAFAIRIDVAEELGRLAAHLDEIEAILKRGGEAGKRLEFLIQELHREANTLGSKAATLELTRISVDMKVLIEQMREQVQNIE